MIVAIFVLRALYSGVVRRAALSASCRPAALRAKRLPPSRELRSSIIPLSTMVVRGLIQGNTFQNNYGAGIDFDNSSDIRVVSNISTGALENKNDSNVN